MKKLAHYKKEANTLRAVERRMDSSGETQVSLTDPDARDWQQRASSPAWRPAPKWCWQKPLNLFLTTLVRNLSRHPRNRGLQFR